MELDAELSPAHLAHALTLQLFDRDWPGALEAYGRSARAPGGTVHTPWHGWLTMFLVGQGRFEEALSRTREELERDPIGPTAFVAGWALHKARRFDASLERLQWTLELWPDYPVTLPFLAANRLRTMREEAYLDPFNLAVACAGLGERDAALDELERLVEEGSPQSWAIPSEPFFDPLRDEPRFDAVLDRLDLPRLEF